MHSKHLNPYQSPSETADVTRHTSRFVVALAGAGKGAMRGAVIAQLLTLFSLALIVIKEQDEHIRDAQRFYWFLLVAAILAILAHGVLGALFGASIGGALGWLRWKASPLQEDSDNQTRIDDLETEKR